MNKSVRELKLSRASLVCSRELTGNDWLIPTNVVQAVTFYPTHGLIGGRRKIVPADPEHTTILGNFPWEYKGEPAVCHGFSWRGRLLSKGHTEIECDPKVWAQVKTLILRRLPDTIVTQTNASELHLPPPNRGTGFSEDRSRGRGLEP
jgi:hypothetical protein